MPRPNDISPTITEEDGPMAGQRKAHAAYGMLRFSRVSGDPGKLFGSEINHNAYIQMELCPGEEQRHLSNTWYFGRSKCLCQVKMSSAQFAELITSLNMGSGVPVTIDYLADDMGQRPGIKDEDTLHETIKREVKKEANDAFKDADSLVKTLRATLETSKLPKAKQKELINLAEQLSRAVHDSMPFIVDQYQEAAEKVAAKAKAELDAYATNIIHRLGEKALNALNEGATTLKLTD